MSQYAPKKPSKINSFSVTLTLILVVGGYFGWWYLPHWFKVWRMSGVLVTVGRDGYREFDDEKLMKKLVSEGRRLDLRVNEDNFAIKREPYSPEELSKYQDRTYPEKRGKSIKVAFAIVIPAEWPLLGGVTNLTFERQKQVDISTVTW